MTTRRLSLTVAVLALLVGVLGVSSLAVFTDTESVDSNVFGVGTVDLVAAPTTAVFNAPAMAPGDEVVAPLDITNGGTLALRYAATSTTSEDVLAAALDLTVKVGVTTCDAANFSADGTVLYGPNDLGSTGTTAIFGSIAQGADAGDRTLAPAASEELCIRVALPLSADNSSQGATTTAVFDFVAEQTSNNP